MVSSPEQIVQTLNDAFGLLDDIIEKFPTLSKVETVGGVYMAMGNLTENPKEGVIDMIKFSCSITEMLSLPPLRSLEVRMGMNLGACSSGQVGKIRPRTCLFGDTINVSSRMASTGVTGHVQISEAVRDSLVELGYLNTKRGATFVKGKGYMKTYW